MEPLKHSPEGQTHSPTPPFYDTIIIGAGIAGLYIAQLLRAQGQTVLVLEARDRIGGRLFTRTDLADVTADSHPIELGAEFVHGLPPELVTLINEQDFEPREGEFLSVGSSGTGSDNHLDSEAPEFFATLGAIFRVLIGDLPLLQKVDLSFAAYLAKKFPELRAAEWARVNQYIEGYHGADIQLISARSLAIIEKEAAESNVMAETFFFRGGYHRLVQKIATEIGGGATIRLQHIVQRIDWDATGATVYVNQPSFNTDETRPQDLNGLGDSAVLRLRARSVVITVPVGVLQGASSRLGKLTAVPPQQPLPGEITFNPPLPTEKLQAIHHLKMGLTVKIHYVFRTPFWRKIPGKIGGGWKILIDQNAPTPGPKTWWQRGNSLIGCVGGKVAGEWPDPTPAQLRSTGIAAIARLFKIPPAEIEEYLVGIYTHNWTTDPFARGVYHYALVGGDQAPAILGQPVSETLFFAGEATQTGGFAGTVNGALLSALRVEREISSRSNLPIK